MAQSRSGLVGWGTILLGIAAILTAFGTRGVQILVTSGARAFGDSFSYGLTWTGVLLAGTWSHAGEIIAGLVGLVSGAFAVAWLWRVFHADDFLEGASALMVTGFACAFSFSAFQALAQMLHSA